MPGQPWRLRPSRTRFVTSPRIGYASRPNGQLTAEVSHLLDLQPCWLLLGLAPTGKRRLVTAHGKSRRRAVGATRSDVGSWISAMQATHWLSDVVLFPVGHRRGL